MTRGNGLTIEYQDGDSGKWVDIDPCFADGRILDEPFTVEATFEASPSEEDGLAEVYLLSQIKRLGNVEVTRLLLDDLFPSDGDPRPSAPEMISEINRLLALKSDEPVEEPLSSRKKIENFCNRHNILAQFLPNGNVVFQVKK